MNSEQIAAFFGLSHDPNFESYEEKQAREAGREYADLVHENDAEPEEL